MSVFFHLFRENSLLIKYALKHCCSTIRWLVFNINWRRNKLFHYICNWEIWLYRGVINITLYAVRDVWRTCCCYVFNLFLFFSCFCLFVCCFIYLFYLFFFGFFFALFFFIRCPHAYFVLWKCLRPYTNIVLFKE